MLNTDDNFTLFQYFDQRHLSRKKHALQYLLNSLCSAILNYFSKHMVVCVLHTKCGFVIKYQTAPFFYIFFANAKTNSW